MKNVAVLLITGSVYFSRFPTNIKPTTYTEIFTIQKKFLVQNVFQKSKLHTYYFGAQEVCYLCSILALIILECFQFFCALFYFDHKKSGHKHNTNTHRLGRINCLKDLRD